jgi:hypothetical protein
VGEQPPALAGDAGGEMGALGLSLIFSISVTES